MKKFNKLNPLIIAICLNLIIVGCGQTNKNEVEESSKNVSSVPKMESEQILNSYLEIKNALVDTDGELAKSKATLLVNILKSKNDLVQKIKFDANIIAETNDVGRQRHHFNTLSDNIYKLVKCTSSNENVIYRQYCPMAFNNKGAYWLSAEKEVNNPYFGDQMLHCGRVTEEF